MSSDDPRIGSVFGNFRLLRKLGEGGMGVVYEAEHHTIGRRAAVKVMHAEFAKNDEYAKRFLNEARAVNIIRHPGLVEIFEFGQEQDGSLYIVMEFLEGKSLYDRYVQAGIRPKPIEAARLGEQAADQLGGHVQHRVGHASPDGDVAATGRVLTGMLRTFGLVEHGWDAIAAKCDPQHAARASWLGPSRHLRWDGDVVVLLNDDTDGKRTKFIGAGTASLSKYVRTNSEGKWTQQLNGDASFLPGGVEREWHFGMVPDNVNEDGMGQGWSDPEAPATKPTTMQTKL
mgnify:CR=1 FL=1